MTNKTINHLGSIASILGLVLALLAVFKTDYRYLAILSLFVVEAIALFIWIFHVRRMHNMKYPHDFEIDYILFRYVFDTPVKMRFEAIRSIRITSPRVNSLPFKLWWTGSGKISITSILPKEQIPFEYDGNTGVISFDFPLGKHGNFGETTSIHYSVELEDTSGANLPQLSLRVTKPTTMVLFEAVLKYKDSNPKATFGYRTDSRANLWSKLGEVSFDEQTRTYRKLFANPVVGYEYRLKWTK